MAVRILVIPRLSVTGRCRRLRTRRRRRGRLPARLAARRAHQVARWRAAHLPHPRGVPRHRAAAPEVHLLAGARRRRAHGLGPRVGQHGRGRGGRGAHGPAAPVWRAAPPADFAALAARAAAAAASFRSFARCVSRSACSSSQCREPFCAKYSAWRCRATSFSALSLSSSSGSTVGRGARGRAPAEARATGGVAVGRAWRGGGWRPLRPRGDTWRCRRRDPQSRGARR